MIKKIKSVSDRTAIFKTDIILIIVSIFLWRLPTALGFRNLPFSHFFLLLPIIFGIFMNLFYIRKNHIQIILSKKTLILVSIFLLLWIIGLIRTASYKISISSLLTLELLLGILTLSLLVFVSFIANPEKEQQLQLKKSIIFSMGFFVFMNLVFYVLGINSHDQLYKALYPSQILSLFNVNAFRVLFPMAQGINSFGCFAGAALVGSFNLFLAHVKLKERIIAGFFTICSISVMIMTDSRGAILFSFLSMTLLMVPRKLIKYTGWVAILISILPLAASIFLPSLLKSSISIFNRPHSVWSESDTGTFDKSCQDALEKSGGTLSNRPVIWNVYLGHLSQLQPIDMVGFGFRGQMGSSLSSKYACLFKSYENPFAASAHNIWLQTIIDIGYVGLLISLMVLVVVISSLNKSILNKFGYIDLGLLNIILYIILVGALEALLNPDWTLFIPIVYISISSVFQGNEFIRRMDAI